MSASSSPRFQAADFHPGAAVVTADGTQVGRLHRVIVDAQSWALRELIVEESRHFSGHLLAPRAALMTQDLIVPLDAVAAVTHARIDLTLTAADARALPPYLSYTYGPAPESVGEAVSDAIAPLGVGMAPTHLTELASKGASELEISPGEPVMLGHTGRRLGRVRDVLFDGTEMVGIVVDPGGLFAEDVILQVRFLDRSDDAALFARLTDEDLENLAPFHPEDWPS